MFVLLGLLFVFLFDVLFFVIVVGWCLCFCLRFTTCVWLVLVLFVYCSSLFGFVSYLFRLL